MSDEIIGSQPLSIGLATHPSSSDDFAVLTGPREESRDYEQLGQREVVNGIHSPIFGHRCSCVKGLPTCKVASKVSCVYLLRDPPAAHLFGFLGRRASPRDQWAVDRIGGYSGRA